MDGEAGLFISPRHPLAESWRKGDEPLPMVLPMAGSHVESLVLRDLAVRGIVPMAVARAQRVSTALSLAINGVGAYFGFVSAMREHITSGKLMRLEVGPINLYRYVVFAAKAPEDAVVTAERYFSALVQRE